jgi:hypothetical protein
MLASSRVNVQIEQTSVFCGSTCSQTMCLDSGLVDTGATITAAGLETFGIEW